MCRHTLYTVACPTGKKKTTEAITAILQMLLTRAEQRVIACSVWDMLSSEAHFRKEAAELGERKPDWALGFVEGKKTPKQNAKVYSKSYYTSDFKAFGQAIENKGRHSSLSYGGKSKYTSANCIHNGGSAILFLSCKSPRECFVVRSWGWVKPQVFLFDWG